MQVGDASDFQIRLPHEPRESAQYYHLGLDLGVSYSHAGFSVWRFLVTWVVSPRSYFSFSETLLAQHADRAFTCLLVWGETGYGGMASMKQSRQFDNRSKFLGPKVECFEKRTFLFGICLPSARLTCFEQTYDICDRKRSLIFCSQLVRFGDQPGYRHAEQLRQMGTASDRSLETLAAHALE